MIKVDILTPEWSRSIEAEAIFLPGTLGEFEVLNNHAPIISTLTGGRIKWRGPEGEDSLEIKRGVVKLRDNGMKICVEV